MSTTIILVSILLVLGSFSLPAQAQLPFEHLNEKVLREPNPFSFIVFNNEVNLSPEDFTIDGKNTSWIPGSMQWVRVGNGKDEAGILIPRARIRENGKEQEIALTQVDNPYKIGFKPRTELKKHVYFDSSCSPYNVRLNHENISHSWVMISCHRINNDSDLVGAKPVLLTTVLWENELKGTLTQVKLDSENPKQTFTNDGSDSFEIEASVAPVFHHLGLSAGVGPYSSRNEIKPFVTIYASYFFNDALKLASFGALPIRSKPEIDWGGYLVMEQFRGVDERISLNLLLGAHLLSYVSATGSRTNSMSGPQGIELTFRDLFIKNLNFVTGGFFYPKINDRSYLNAWVRYGSNQYFMELNFIEWQEPNPYFYSKSFGVSVGFPLFRAL